MESGEYRATVEALQQAFRSGRSRPLRWRREQLHSLGRFLREREAEIAAALHDDLGKSPAEAWLTESSWLQGEIRFVLRRLRRWMRSRRAVVPLLYQPARASWSFEPHGVVLVLGAWNYPLQLCLAPLIGALAAGNCVLLKPSEQAPATSALLARLLGKYLDSDAVRVVEGGATAAEALFEEPFDFFFYTGSRAGGRAVMEAAARRLVPLALELGGKSPCIVHRDASVRTTARRIAWAKSVNAGQTCIAPDYLLVHEERKEALVAAIGEALREFYPADSAENAFPRVITTRQAGRLQELLGGTGCSTGLPCIVELEGFDSPLMQQELFGPILPVIAYRELDTALQAVRELDDPLAVYLFSNDSGVEQLVRDRLRFGGLCLNDLLFQAALSSLPFGGVGRSGFGSYHGEAGFETFSRRQSTLHRSLLPDPSLRYPPYGNRKFRLLRRLVELLQ